MAKLNAQLVIVTPEMARHLRKTCHYDRQRTISGKHVARLAHEMRQGRFVQGTQVHFAVLPNGAMKLVNGQHTLEAVVLANLPQQLNFLYTPVAEEAEIAALYARHDMHRGRSWSDAFRAFDAGAGLEMDSGWASALGAAAGLVAAGFDHGFYDSSPEIRSRVRRIEWMRQMKPQAEAYVDACRGASNTDRLLFRRRAVYAIGLETCRHQPSRAREFWRAMALDDGLKRSDPRKTLLTWLRENPASPRNVTETLAAVMVAWNAWYGDRTLSQIRPTAVKNFYLLGTPYYAPGMAPPRWVDEDGTAVALDDRPLFETGVAVSSEGVSGVTVFGTAAE